MSFIDQANAWLASYVQAHSQRFGVWPRGPQDAHLTYSASDEALQHICALHHQRQLNMQLSCQFEGSVVQIHPGQAHAPRRRAKVDIVEFDDVSLAVLCHGSVFKHSHYQLYNHLAKAHSADARASIALWTLS